MRLDRRVLGSLFRTELKMVLRDQRTVVASIVLPLLVMPVMLLGSSWMAKKRQAAVEGTTYRFAVAGSQAEAVRELVDGTLVRLAEEERVAAATPVAPGAEKAAPLRLALTPVADPAAALKAGEVHFWLEGSTAEEALAAQPKPSPAPREDRAREEGALERRERRAEVETPAPGLPVVTVVFRGDRDASGTAARRVAEALRATRRARQAELLGKAGFPVAARDVVAVAETNLASEGQVAGLALGRTMTLLLLLFMLSGGAVVATDSLAGEKERGTLETLLTTAASRLEIVLAKHLVILAVALVVTVIQVLNFLVYVGFKLIPAPVDFAAAVSPGVALLLLVLYLPIAALVSSVLLMTSGRARTFKEAQLYFLPVFLLGMLPAASPFLPGLPLRSAIVLVPVANLALAVKEVLIGSFDWPMIALSWLVTAAAAAWATRASVHFLSAEKLIAAVEADAVDFRGGAPLFERHVLRWYALVWAALLVVSGYAGESDIRVQLLLNLVLLFFGASLLMIRRYQLDPREALALRPPRPAVWLGVLCGAPSALVVGFGVFELASLFVPVPEKVLESFSTALLDEKLSVPQLLLFLCAMPGFFEEIAFRGVLLHGLRRRFHPAVLALVVGGIFGLFHGALFRVAPTAYLGVVLAAVTLLSGSIYPAMLWHALNNALAVVVLPRLGQDPGVALSPTVLACAAAVLAVSFWIVWRNRTPYPGLRPWRHRR